MRQNILKQVIRERHREWLLPGLPCEKSEEKLALEAKTNYDFLSERVREYRRDSKLKTWINKALLNIPTPVKEQEDTLITMQQHGYELNQYEFLFKGRNYPTVRVTRHY